MKKYNIYYYKYKFDFGYHEAEYVDTIYLDESDTICDGIRQAKLDHDLYNILDECSNGVYELTSKNSYDYYRIVPKGKYQ